MLAAHQSFIIPCPTLQQVQSAGVNREASAVAHKVLDDFDWPCGVAGLVPRSRQRPTREQHRVAEKALVRARLTTTVRLRVLLNAQVDGSLHAMKEASVHKQKLGCYHAGKTVTSFGRICP